MISNIRANKIKEFTDLIAWQEGHKLVLIIYKVTKKYPREEVYSLVDQSRRCVISITSNIAEGFGRHSYKEKIQYFYQAQGSLTELKNQLYIARDVGYIIQGEFDQIIFQAHHVHKLLQGLITKTKALMSSSSNS